MRFDHFRLRIITDECIKYLTHQMKIKSIERVGRIQRHQPFVDGDSQRIFEALLMFNRLIAKKAEQPLDEGVLQRFPLT
ncbi:hypothetical protein D3C86_1686160 [compost metagenome]